MTHEAREKGRIAEERVFFLAQSLGLLAQMGDPTQDYAEKTDVIVEGRRIQVSASLKSKGERERLAKRGIVNIPAGPSVTDEAIIANIESLLR